MYGDIVWSHRGRQIGPRTTHQQLYVDAIRANTITFGIGPAGTGKTYLAVAAAVEAFSNKRVGRIILTRPAVEAGESLGFLPGTVSEKVDPYFRPLFDALYDMMSGDKLAALIEKGEIEIAPLAYMRGRTLNDSFVILDEAQNTTPEQIKMFLTRLGFGSLIVVTGDAPRSTCRAAGNRAWRSCPGARRHPRHLVRHFDHRDVVRHKLVQRIVAAYKDYGERSESEREPAAAVSQLTIEVVNLTRLAVAPDAVAGWSPACSDDEGLTRGELGVRFVGARRMRDLNRDYLGHDEVTDVLRSRSKTAPPATTAAALSASRPVRTMRARRRLACSATSCCARGAPSPRRAPPACRSPSRSPRCSCTAPCTSWATTTRPMPGRWPPTRRATSKARAGRACLPKTDSSRSSLLQASTSPSRGSSTWSAPSGT